MVVNALLWLKQNNKYYRKIKIGNDALKLLPEDGQLTNLTTEMRIGVDDQSTAKGQEENTSTSVVPILDSKLTYQKFCGGKAVNHVMAYSQQGSN